MIAGAGLVYEIQVLLWNCASPTLLHRQVCMFVCSSHVVGTGLVCLFHVFDVSAGVTQEQGILRSTFLP